MSLRSSLSNTSRVGGRWWGELALALPLTEFGVIGVTGMVSVFHRQASRPLQSAGLFCQPW